MLIKPVDIRSGTKGPWTVERFEVKDDDIASIRAKLQGRPVYEGTYTRLMHERRGVVMSDTPAEMTDHCVFISKAKGHVLINGLGIGMCLAAVLRKKEVTKVTVVELEQDVIDLVWPNYASDRCEIFCCDAFEYQPPKGIRYGAVWHDIWDSICSDNLSGMHRLHRKYGRRTDWQGSWCRSACERNR